MVIPVEMGAQSYNITLRRGALADAGKLMQLERKALVVTDSGVPGSYAEAVAAQCAEAHIVCVPAGEASKSMDSFKLLLSAMLNAGFTRGDCVVAVGGGVVGDLSAFAASCYMRGIDFYNIPTTLLSQVDSSVGGKTAIDFEGVKNIVGSFYQPKAVLIDPDTLKTLDARQLRAGLAEAIKMAATCDRELFAAIESCDDLEAALPDIIARSLAIKTAVVEQDPREAGLRKVLNFGHTVGHAIESLNAGRLLHGECVALGMLPMCSDEARGRLRIVLEKYALPTATEAGVDELIPYIMHDKKLHAGLVSAVCVDSIGSFSFRDMSADELKEKLEESL